MTKADLDKRLKGKVGSNLLTSKERRFLHAYLNLIERGDNVMASRTEAMLMVSGGDMEREVASAMASQYFRKIKGKIGEVFDLAGMDDVVLVYRIIQGTNATIEFQRKDEVISYPDWRTRFQYLKMIAELKGHLGAGVNLNFNQTNVQNNIVVLPESDDVSYDPAQAIREFAKLQLPANSTGHNGTNGSNGTNGTNGKQG